MPQHITIILGHPDATSYCGALADAYALAATQAGHEVRLIKLDRVFLPGFAFKYRQNSPLWDRPLSGRSAHVITTMDTPPWYFRWVYRMPGHHQMKRTILEFSGIKPVRITSLGPMRYATPERRAAWLAELAAFARKA